MTIINSFLRLFWLKIKVTIELPAQNLAIYVGIIFLAMGYFANQEGFDTLEDSIS